MTVNDSNELRCLIVEPLAQYRDQLTKILNTSYKFKQIYTSGNLDEAREFSSIDPSINYLFLSNVIDDQVMAAFLKGLKESSAGKKIRTVHCILPGADSRRKLIEKAIVLGIDALYFAPFSIATAVSVIDSVETSNNYIGPHSPLVLLIYEVSQELDVISLDFASNKEVMRAFKDRLAVLRKFSPEELESYYTTIIEFFTQSHPVPPSKRKVTYSGVSRRVKSFVDQYNKSLDLSKS